MNNFEWGFYLMLLIFLCIDVDMMIKSIQLGDIKDMLRDLYVLGNQIKSRVNTVDDHIYQMILDDIVSKPDNSIVVTMVHTKPVVFKKSKVKIRG